MPASQRACKGTSPCWLDDSGKGLCADEAFPCRLCCHARGMPIPWLLLSLVVCCSC